MATQNFRLLINGFESQTRTSHKKAVSLSTDTTDKLRVTTDPALQAIYTIYLVHHEAYIALNLAVEISEGTYKGKTAGFETIMNTVGNKLRSWEPPIRVLFPEDSPVEMEIFPNKRTPFYAGTYEQRLLAVKALRDKLLEYTVANPSLVAVQADVAAFFTLANTARQTQQGKEGEESGLRTQREAQRVITMNAYWGIVYAGLLQQFYTTPDRIADLIDFGLLYDYRTEELIETLNVNGNNTIVNVPLADVSVTANTKFRIKNPTEQTGSLAIVYFGNTLIAGPGEPPIGIVLNGGDNRIVTAAELGFADSKPFLNIMNPSTNTVEVEIWEVK